MITAVWIVSLVAAALTIADQVRRPPSEWTAADRDRGYWIGATAMAGFVALGPVAALVYAIGVVPRFSNAGRADGAFRKGAQQSAYLPPDPQPQPQLAAPVAPAQPAAARTGRLVVDLDGDA